MTRLRAAFLGLVTLSLLVALIAASAGTGASSPVRVRVTFTGSGSGTFADVERWIFLENGECYLRRTRTQQVQLTWSATWNGVAGGALRPGPVTASGVVSGTEVRDTCDEDELPPDPPENWIQSLTCSDPLSLSGGATAAWAGTRARPVLRLQGPSLSLAREAVCTAIPRTQELFATVPVARAALEKLKVGKSLSIKLGTTLTRFGDYTPNANCQHNAKPYDGYRSEDSCADQLTWNGGVRITRLR